MLSFAHRERERVNANGSITENIQVSEKEQSIIIRQSSRPWWKRLNLQNRYEKTAHWTMNEKALYGCHIIGHNRLCGNIIIDELHLIKKGFEIGFSRI